MRSHIGLDACCLPVVVGYAAEVVPIGSPSLNGQDDTIRTRSSSAHLKKSLTSYYCRSTIFATVMVISLCSTYSSYSDVLLLPAERE
jgi:hypothetical protein